MAKVASIRGTVVIPFGAFLKPVSSKYFRRPCDRQTASTIGPGFIETISQGITLYPGDVIATGLSAAVGISFKPLKFLTDGDIVSIEIGGLGRLESPVRSVSI